jgi:hypothetical protein
MISRVTVQSDRDTDVEYRITLVGNTAVACTCPHFNFRATTPDFVCKHMRRITEAAPLTVAELARIRALLNKAV